MSFSIDKLPNESYIREYASQYNSIPIGFIQQCDSFYSGNNSKDVLYGLIVGFANAQNMVKQVDPNAKSINSLGMIICYLAKKYLEL